MAENKVVIKINYDKHKNRKSIAEPEMITVWHTRRILVAVLILIILVVIPIFWFIGGEDRNFDKVERTEYLEKGQMLTNTDPVIEESGAAIDNVKPLTATVASEKQSVNKNGSVQAISKRPAAIIYNRRVIRASLNTGNKAKEPYAAVKLPVRLSKNQAIEIFYFNELRGLNDRALFHYWSRDGQVLDKRPLNINHGRTKVLSARTFGYNDNGEWQIQLVDSKGKVLSEVNFFVTQE